MGLRESRAFGHLASSGVVGAAAVAGLHQLARYLLKDAPRMDVWGEEALKVGFGKLGLEPPKAARAWSWLAGNVGSDALLFGAVGAAPANQAVARGTALGALTGVAAVLGPRLLRLGPEHTSRSFWTALTTVGLYAGAGFAAGAAKWVRSR